MPISNVALTNTFNEWRVTTNQLIVATNDILGDGLVTYRSVTANVVNANTVFAGGLNVQPTLTAALNQANIAFTRANNQANLAFYRVNANNILLTSTSNASTLTMLTRGNVAITADAAGLNLTLDLTTTGVTAAVYGNGTIVPVITVDSRGRLTSVTNTTIGFGNTFSTVIANGTSLVSDSSSDTLEIRTTGNVAITTDVNGDNLTFDLTTTGVTPAIYGNATIVPAFTVDARGRLISVTNTNINFPTSDFSGVVFKTGNTMTGNLVMSGANIAFSTATNSGIYWSGTSFLHSPATNILVLGTNSLERMRIDSSGSVGIGTSSPVTPLHVVRSTTGSAALISGSTRGVRVVVDTVGTSIEGVDNTGIGSYQQLNIGGSVLAFTASGSEKARMDGSGNFGIGTVSPAANLDVVGSISDAKANNLSQTLTGTPITWDGSLGRIATVTLTSSTSISNITNPRIGTYILHVIQGGSGNYTLDFELGYRFTGNVRPVLSTSVGARDMFSFVSDGSKMYGAMIPDVG